MEKHGAVGLVIEGRAHDLGGLIVSRVLPFAKRRALGPFVFLDHLGPTEIEAGRNTDVRPHPHIGLSTVTWQMQGTNVHRDHLGNVVVGRPGDLNIMTAGRGIVHSERAEPQAKAQGYTLWILQLWLALPRTHERIEPYFEHFDGAAFPTVEPASGVRARVLLGSAFGQTSTAHHPSRPVLVEVSLSGGASLDLPVSDDEIGVFVVSGRLEVDGHTLTQSQLAVLTQGCGVRLHAHAPTRLFVLGGPTLDGPRLIQWNFVASEQSLIDDARQAWIEGRFPQIPGDADEFIPWPGVPAEAHHRP